MQITIEEVSSNETGGVVSVKWSMRASNGVVEIKDIGISRFMPDPSADGFIPFDQLKESDVVGWVSKNINASAVEQRLINSIAEQNTSFTNAFPWNQGV